MAKRPSLAESMASVREPTKPDPETLVSKRSAAEAPKKRPAATAPGPVERPSMKKMLIPIDPEVHRNLKRLAVDMDGGTLEKIVQLACAEYVERHRAKA